MGSVYKGVKKNLLDEEGILIESSDSESAAKAPTNVTSKKGSKRGSPKVSQRTSPVASRIGSRRKTSVDSKSTKPRTNVLSNHNTVTKERSKSPFTKVSTHIVTDGKTSISSHRPPKNLGTKATSMGVFMTKSRSIVYQGKHTSQPQMNADLIIDK